MKTIKIFGVLFLVFVLAFSPISFFNIIALSQSVDEEEITGYQEWNQDRSIDKNVVVKSGATLVIGKDVEISFTNPSIGIRVEGNLFIKGTVKEPSIIKNDQSSGGFSITAETGSNVIIRNAEVLNGGTEAFLVRKTNTAIAASYTGAIQVNGGNVDVQNVTFKNNLYAVIVSSEMANVRVNRSRFIDNNFDVESGDNDDDFRYNWWGGADGPRETCYDYPNLHYCNYDKISGNFDHSDHLSKESFRDPVLIIPGISGSQKKDGKFVIDPVYHIYDNLYDAFVDNGYVPEKDLFVFPYEWRDSNVENAKLLRNKINEVKQLVDWPKIDIIAHSMGGLLAREYVESDYYSNDVDQLITLATPQLGAPEAYIRWEGASGFLSTFDLYVKHILVQEAEEGGFPDMFDYIHNRPMASLQELLPVYDYLYDLDRNEELRSYPNNYPRNEFLENLNSNSRLENLNKVEFDKIIGNLNNSSSTIFGFNVINVDLGKYWVHGYLHGFEVFSERGIRYSNGDATVPLYSAKSENIKSDYLIELSSDHQSIVTDSQKDVLELLTGIRPQEEIRRSFIYRILFISVYSPIDIQIISPSNKKMGKNFETGEIYNEIPGAYYTGYNTENEFITIPNPEDGKYKILMQGTGDGAYRVEAVKIIKGATPSDEAKESVATLTGTAATGATEEKKIELLPNDTVVPKEDEQDNDTIAPTITISSPENKSYLNNQTLPTTYSVTDNISPEEKITKAVKLDGTTFDQATIDLSLQSLGDHILSVQATDEAENITTQSVNFENTATFDSLKKNINHYFSLGLIKNKREVKYIQAFILYLEKLEETINHLERMPYFPPQVKVRLTQKFQRELEHQKKKLFRYLEQGVEKGIIDIKAKDRIAEVVEKLVQ